MNEAETNGVGSAGSLLLADPTTGQYAFNWSPKGRAVGRYRLWTDLQDGVGGR